MAARRHPADAGEAAAAGALALPLVALAVASLLGIAAPSGYAVPTAPIPAADGHTGKPQPTGTREGPHPSPTDPPSTDPPNTDPPSAGATVPVGAGGSSEPGTPVGVTAVPSGAPGSVDPRRFGDGATPGGTSVSPSANGGRTRGAPAVAPGPDGGGPGFIGTDTPLWPVIAGGGLLLVLLIAVGLFVMMRDRDPPPHPATPGPPDV